MQELDEKCSSNGGDEDCEEDMFLNEVIVQDHQLLYLDSYLREVLKSE